MTDSDVAGETVPVRRAAELLGKDEKTIRAMMRDERIVGGEGGKVPMSEVERLQSELGIASGGDSQTIRELIRSNTRMAEMLERYSKLIPEAADRLLIASDRIMTQQSTMLAKREEERLQLLAPIGEILERKEERIAHARMAEERSKQIAAFGAKFMEHLPEVMTQVAGARQFKKLVETADPESIQGFREMAGLLENKKLGAALLQLLESFPGEAEARAEGAALAAAEKAESDAPHE
jgi:hypothetical protein